MRRESMFDTMQLFKRSRDIFCRPVLEKYSLRVSDMDVLLFLSARNAPCTAREICDMYMAPKSLISASVEALAQRGLIARSPHPQDKRCILLTLRSEADEIISALNECSEEFGRRICEGVSTDEMAVVERVFGRIHRNMNALSSTE